MSEEKISEDDDSWVFDSLINFLHGVCWKLPVLGFIEEKSVVFDPDSYNNMTDEKEEEYRKIHEEYKALVDYMLANFMEDLQVTPEQVEEGCRIRSERNKDQPESNITKQALEQLWAAEDFGAFRRLMTRKNIDLQLQSLELLVARYGVLSPALCPFDSSSEPDPNGEEDFLQVVISYTEPQFLFNEKSFQSSLGTNCCQPPIPQLQLSSNSKTIRAQINPNVNKSVTKCTQNSTLDKDELEKMTKNSLVTPLSVEDDSPIKANQKQSTEPSTVSCHSNFDDDTYSQEGNENNKKETTDLLVTPQTDDSTRDNEDAIIVADKLVPSTKSNCLLAPITFIDSQILQQEENERPGPIVTTPEPAVSAVSAFPAIAVEHSEEKEDAGPSSDPDVETKLEDNQGEPSQSSIPSLGVDSVTVAEMASVVPEQHRILTAVRRAFDVPSEGGDEEPFLDTSAMMPVTGTEEEIQRRREYLRSQRDKLVALKKREREKQIINFGRGDGQASNANSSMMTNRPKSAKAAQIAIRNPNAIDKSSSNEKSLQARRALAQRLKQELVDK